MTTPPSTAIRALDLPTIPEAKGHEILAIEVGSTLHGTGIPGGEDLDILAIAIPPAHVLLRPKTGYVTPGTIKPWETHVWRTAEQRHQSDVAAGRCAPLPRGEKPKSEPGDIDYVCYSLAKFTGLALDGNPTVLVALWAPVTHILRHHPEGIDFMHKARTWAASREALPRWRGYLQGQRDRFLGLTARHGRIRQEQIIGPDGVAYDAKYAMHMVRLAHQGIEYAQTGKLTLPMVGEAAEECRAIRRGEWTRAAILDRIDFLDGCLATQIEGSALREYPDIAAATEWMLAAYQRAWGWDG